MLKTLYFLRKTTFFNTFLVIFLCFSVQGICAQTLEHGESFELSTDIIEVSDLFEDLMVSDSLHVQLKGTIAEVCQARGCWMNVNLMDGGKVFVKFKDYGFFVPMDSAGKEVILDGMAFVEEMSVKDQQHYAKDKGATEQEAAKITAPKRTFRFEAAGVRISSSN